MTKLRTVFALAASLLLVTTFAHAAPNGPIKNVVLVHGGFVDGAGWRGVYDILKKDGFNVAIVQNPTLSFTGDGAATRPGIDAQGGRGVLVGHPYGGSGLNEP